MLAKVETLPTQQAREKNKTKKSTMQLLQQYPKTPRAIYMYRKCEMTPARKGLSSLIHTLSFFFFSRSLRTSSPCRNEWNAFVVFLLSFHFKSHSKFVTTSMEQGTTDQKQRREKTSSNPIVSTSEQASNLRKKIIFKVTDYGVVFQSSFSIRVAVSLRVNKKLAITIDST